MPTHSEQSAYSAGQVRVLERLTAIETKLDQYNLTKDTAYQAAALAERNAGDIRDAKDRLREIENNADIAKNLAEQCQDDVSEIKDGSRWMTRTAIGLALVTLINLTLNLLQGVPTP